MDSVGTPFFFWGLREGRGFRAGVPPPASSRARGCFQLREPTDGVGGVVAAHLARRLKAATEDGPRGKAEEAAAQVGIELDAGDAGWLAIGHAGDGARDGRGGAAGAAAGPA